MADADAREQNRAIYGRGYHDGMRAAARQQPKDIDMTPAKLEATERGLSGLARKALDATPIADSWDVKQIATEMHRLTGAKADIRFVHGAMNSMVEQGLVKEGPRGSFKRVVAKPRVHLVEAATNTEPPPMPPPAPEIAPAPREQQTIDRLAAVAEQARKLAGALQTLAADIETAAIEAEERMQQIHKDSAKLRQLQELLKGL